MASKQCYSLDLDPQLYKDPPMGIDQVPHSMYSLNSSKGASKSGAIDNTVP